MGEGNSKFKKIATPKGGDIKDLIVALQIFIIANIFISPIG